MSEIVLNSFSVNKDFRIDSKSSAFLILSSSSANKSENLSSIIDQSTAIEVFSRVFVGIEITSRPYDDIYDSDVESSMPLKEIIGPIEPLDEQTSESKIRPPRTARGI